MTEAQVTIMVAVIGLAGTLAGVQVAYRKWKHEVKREKSGEFEREQQAVYKEPWNRLEGLNVDMRIEELDQAAFSQRRQELNAFMLKAGLYLDDQDRSLANQYLAAVRHFHTIVRNSGREDAVAELGDTADIPAEILESVHEIHDAQTRALDLRDHLIHRVRRIMGSASV